MNDEQVLPDPIPHEACYIVYRCPTCRLDMKVAAPIMHGRAIACAVMVCLPCGGQTMDVVSYEPFTPSRLVPGNVTPFRPS